jgi:hypothetical protein
MDVSHHIIFFFLIPSRVFSFTSPVSMANASESGLNIGAPVEKQGRGRPRGSKNKATIVAVASSSSAPTK